MQKQLIPDPRVANRYGVSQMTLWRWDRDPELNFPKPIRIRGRKYRNAEELDAFDAQRTAERDGAA
jgi:predicted DNA-binding transcriptional regulator AlpA